MPGPKQKSNKRRSRARRVENDDPSTFETIESSIGDIVPGKALERAAATITTATARAALRGMGTIFGAVFEEFVARKLAKAKVIRTELETQAKISKSSALIAARRQHELEEVTHKTHLEIVRRRADRMMKEMATEQANFEAVAVRSLEIIENNPDRKPEDVEPDWFHHFAESAQNVSDTDVQELWAKILASNVSSDKDFGRQSTSLAALDKLRLLDRRTALVFKHFWRYWAAFGFIFPNFVPTEDIPDFHYGSDAAYLAELGLLSVRDFGWVTNFGWLKINFSTTPALAGESPTKRSLKTYLLTEIGEEIARVVFGRRVVLTEAALMPATGFEITLEEYFISNLERAMTEKVRYDAIIQYIMMLGFDILASRNWTITLSDSHESEVIIKTSSDRERILKWSPFECSTSNLPTRFVPELNHFGSFEQDFYRLFERYKFYRFEGFMRNISTELATAFLSSVYERDDSDNAFSAEPMVSI